MRGIQNSKQAKFSFLIVTIFTLLLSGCLVENSDPLPIIDRSTDNLRLIQSGDRLVYRITGGQRTIAGTTTFSNATMTVTWTNDVIIDPQNSPSTISVLREDTLIEFEQGGSESTVRYITQDQNNGSLFVHAYYENSPTLPIVYMGDFVSNAVTYLYQPIQTVASPLTMSDDAFTYRVIDDCNLTSCATSLKAISEAVQFNSEQVITIDAGRSYNTLYYTYNGIYQEGSSATPLPSPLDYRRTFCGTNAVDFFGEYYYFPEVGLVAFQTACSGFDPATPGLFGHNFSGSLISANFTLP